jgi:hypothetical protein
VVGVVVVTILTTRLSCGRGASSRASEGIELRGCAFDLDADGVPALVLRFALEPAMRRIIVSVPELAILTILSGIGCSQNSGATTGVPDSSVDGVASRDTGDGRASSGNDGGSGSDAARSGSDSGSDGAGGDTGGSGRDGGSDGGGGTFSTNFPAVENPISQSGRFVTATSPGVHWSVMVGGCGCKSIAPVAVTSPGLAQSPNVASNVGDALAVLTGSWGADQTASAVVASLPATSDGYEEIELHLRVDPTTGHGYEITWGYNHNYILIVTWNAGPYVELVNQSDPSYAISPGDTIKASIHGSVITMYINGKHIYTYTDTGNTFTSGNPGFGFNEGAAGNYGISSFSASSP